MRSSLLLTCLPLLLVVITGCNTKPVRDIHGGHGLGADHAFDGEDGYIRKGTPLCDQFVGLGSIDGVSRTDSLQVDPTITHPVTFQSWEARGTQGSNLLVVTVTANSEGLLQIEAWSRGGNLPSKVEVSADFSDTAVVPFPTKWYLNTGKGSTCHFVTGRKVSDLRSVGVYT